VSFPFSIGALALGTAHGGWLLQAIGSSLNYMVVLPLWAIFATLLYFDGRIRGEGFDLQVAAADLSRSGA
jgi:riboflavin transporter FmnP